MLLLLQPFAVIVAQENEARYAPAWFGPNANPVPEMTDARIPQQTTVSLMADYYFGSGDRTKNGYLKAEIPLLPSRISFKVWTSVLEHYNVTEEVARKRGMPNTSGKANGDFYVQTRISILREKKYVPSVILSSTLKTASGDEFGQRRYFNTPGYYFDLELGKSFFVKSRFINEIRVVADAGFICWQTNNNKQNEAPMYGGKIIVGNHMWKLENALAGYHGWISNKDPEQGDAPLVYTGKLSFTTSKVDYFAQYQYGIKDFPYQQVRIGANIRIDKLTPHFVK